MATLWETDVTILRMNHTLRGCPHVVACASLGAIFLPVLTYAKKPIVRIPTGVGLGDMVRWGLQVGAFDVSRHFQRGINPSLHPAQLPLAPD